MTAQDFNIKDYPKAHDITGKKYARLTVIRCIGPKGKQQNMHWECECICGKMVITSSRSLGSGNTRSCGCLKRKPRGPRVKHDIIGQKFGRWVVLQFLGLQKNYQIFLCRCECGCEKEVSVSSLLSGASKSCGCLSREVTIKLMRKEEGEHAFNVVMKGYVYAAKRRGHTFVLTKEQFREIIVKPCFYCGDKGGNTRKTNNGEFIYTGIDRMNNNLGYEMNNIVPCCITCNKFKGVLSFEEFARKMRMILKNISNHRVMSQSKLSDDSQKVMFS